ncbi:NB-ARC domain-containing protein [Streptomyces sp. NBC_00390]|uniref:NB-ARC domain-containing protein n=1 Tax=Streptomyces sp. NBC_00390 TaxID=2975736 RepID=UPI002E1A6CCF
MAATSASIVEALTTDAWQHVRDRMVQLFRNTHPEQADGVSAQLEEARELMLAAQGDSDARVEYELTVTLQRRLQDLMGDDSLADHHLQHLLGELLALSPGGESPHSPLLHQPWIFHSVPAVQQVQQIAVNPAYGRTLPVVPSSSALVPAHSVLDRLGGAARMLPRAVPTFTGRDAEMRELLHVAEAAETSPVYLLHGMPGAGKTALAVRAAHQLAEKFPDGQVFINLRGHDPGDSPAVPFQLLGSLLTAAGIPSEVQPESVHGRAGLWRSWLSSKRVLIILDDAADFGQVEPLLPGYTGCLTVVTSRLRLDAAEVTKAVPVDVLPPETSAQLFDRLLRHRGFEGEADGTREIARLCGNLPLALVLAAGVLLAHPTWQVPHLVDELSHTTRRITRLASGQASLTSALSTSVHSLEATEQRFLRHLCMHPGPELEKRAAAVLTGTTVEYAGTCLDSLYRHSLLTEVSPGRFRMHVLLTSYLSAASADELHDAETEEEPRRRLVDYYRRTAVAAYLLETHQDLAELQIQLPESAPAMNGPSQAAAWLASELDNLAACTQYSADHPEAVADLATIVTAYLLREGDDGLRTAHALIQASHHRVTSRGDTRAEALFTHLSGLLAIGGSDLERAVTELDHAARTSRDDRWDLGTARALYTLHLALRLDGRFDEARTTLEEAMQRFDQAGDRQGLRKAQQQAALLPGVLREPSPAAPTDLAVVAGADDFLTQLENLTLAMHAQRGPSNALTPGNETPEPGSGAPAVPHSGGSGDEPPGKPPGPAGSFEDDDWPEQAVSDPGEHAYQGDAGPQPELSLDDLDAVDAQHINFWFTDTPPDDEPLRTGRSYTGCFQVGPDHPDNLSAGEPGQRIIPPDDIPDSGLLTHWLVWSTTSELTLPDTADARASTGITAAGDAQQWMVEFDLLIPPHGESEERLVNITPRTPGTARIDVQVLVDSDPYRDLTIEFPVEEAPAGSNPPDGDLPTEPDIQNAQDQAADLPAPRPSTPPAVLQDAAFSTGQVHKALRPHQRHRGLVHVQTRHGRPARETALHIPHQWQRAGSTLSLFVTPPRAWWKMEVDGAPHEWRSGTTDWTPQPVAEQRVREVQEALERYRQERADRCNTISASDIAARLKAFQPRTNWAEFPRASDEDEHAWAEDACSVEMQDLAHAGRQLFHSMFPRKSDLESLVSELAPGDRLRIHWKDCTPQHVPWSLLYRGIPPSAGQPVEPHDFLGLRLRITHVPHPMSGPRAIDEDAARAHLMYWGGLPNDATQQTAQEHALELANWRPRILPTQMERRKEELSRFLIDPAPVELIYVFCQAATGAGNRPSLRFGSTNDPCDVLNLADMGDADLDDRPLVFLNACETSAAHHTYSNELQNKFLERGCRAYIGTESKVPTAFAARFACVFFHFLYTRPRNGAPTAAGEALAQARKFFWDEYRSIGGLFYNYINDDQIFVAHPDEVAALRRPSRSALQTS